MTLKELARKIDQLMLDKTNHDKEVIGDIKPGEKLNKVVLYGIWFVVLYDTREQEEVDRLTRLSKLGIK